MQSANNFIVLNIREYLDSTDKRLGEEKLTELLSGFFCPLNPDVERFLKHQAIEFTKKHQAVTYLVLSPEDAELLGYFSITIKPLGVKARGRMTGQELLETAIRQIQILQYQAGGMVVFVEADKKKKLLSFYENYGFKRFDTRQTASNDKESHELVQLLRLL